MQIEPGDLAAPDVQDLLRFHLDDMRSNSPPGLAYALDWAALQDPNVSFWTMREQGQLLGCGALQRLDPVSAEIKSMRTHPDHLRRGVAKMLLDHLIDEARASGYHQVCLETGSTTPFTPALTLYQNRGFTRCEPFSDYTDNGFNLFMRLDLAASPV